MESHNIDNEVLAMDVILKTLSPLDKETSVRILEYICNRLYIRATFELPKKDRVIRSIKESSGYKKAESNNVPFGPKSIRPINQNLDPEPPILDDEEGYEYEGEANSGNKA